MVKLEKIGFIATLVGGLIGLVFGILNLIGIEFFQSVWIGGPGFLGLFLSGIIWPIIALVLCVLAIAVGALKSFTEMLDFDLIIFAIIIIIHGVLIFGIGGYIILIGGILVLLGRFMSD